MYFQFRRSPSAMAAVVVALVLLAVAMFAPWLAPHDTTDIATIDLMDAFLPPAWSDGGNETFPLGTDGQGRCILSSIMFGLRISLIVGVSAVAIAAVAGTLLGLVAGYFNGWLDSLIMRIADIQLTFPSILVALLFDGIVRAILTAATAREFRIVVLTLAIAASQWVNFARTVRSSTLVERNRDYVQAAQLIGLHPMKILLRHVLPNVINPVLVIGTLSLAIAILTEATLSFLGVGMPATNPSLGTMIRIGNNFLLSGEWWMIVFPSAVLVLLVLAVNLLGDWLRDALNPKLRRR
ncbi:MAG: ABC transporter permease [Geminicoccaceae bacterium]